MKKFVFFVVGLISIVNVFSQEFKPSDFSNWKINDTVKTLDKSKSYDLRVYCFLELSSCSVCTNWAIYFGQRYSAENMEIVMILKNTTQEDAEKLKKDLDWKLNVVGDEYGLFHTFYKIKFPMTMIVLDNDGIILDMGKIASPKMSEEHLDELLAEAKKKQVHTENNYIKLKEIARIPVVKNKDGLLSGIRRDVLYDKKHKKFIIRNINNCQIDIADSNGNIYKSIQNDKYYHCMVGGGPMSWANQDSIIAIPSGIIVNEQFQSEVSYLNTAQDEFSKSGIIKFDKDPNQFFLMTTNNFFNAEKNEFTAFLIRSGVGSTYLNKNDTCFYVYDSDEKLIKCFGSPDEVYQKYKLSSYTNPAITYNNKGEAVTMQSHTKNIQLWDKNKNLIKTKELDLLNDFKIIKHDLPDELNMESIAVINNEISIYQTLFCDRANNNIVLSWQNQTFPAGVTDYTSPDVKNEIFLSIFDKDGNRLKSKNILMPSTFIMQDVYDNVIFGTELNKNKLELVFYKIES